MAFTFSIPDSVLSTTLMNYRKQLADNIFVSIPFYYWMMKKGRKLLLSGGESIIVPLLYAQNSTVSDYSGYETIDTTPQEGITSAKYAWTQVAGTVAISGKEEMQNSGENAIINLLQAKTTQLEKSMADYLSLQLFSTNGDSTGPPIGLQAMVAIAGTGTIGGIVSGTYTWWGNQQRNSYDTDGTYATAANLRAGMKAVYNSVSQGNDQPDLILMSQTAFEWYEGILTPLKRFSDTRTADAGFQNLLYKASVCMWDRDFPNNLGGTSSDEGMYFLNSKNLQLVVHSKRDMITTPFIKPENQDAKVAQLLWMGQLVTNNRRMLGVLHGINTS